MLRCTLRLAQTPALLDLERRAPTVFERRPMARLSGVAAGVREPRTGRWCTSARRTPGRLRLRHPPRSASRHGTHIRWPAPGRRAGGHDTTAVRSVSPLN